MIRKRTPKQERNLQVAIAHLESIPDAIAEEHFNLDTWSYNYEPDGNQNDVRKWSGNIQALSPLTCGTTACAAGWIASMPYFYAQGLRRTYTYGLPYINRTNGGDLEGVDAMIHLFGLDNHIADMIFQGGPRFGPNKGAAALKWVIHELKAELSKEDYQVFLR